MRGTRKVKRREARPRPKRLRLVESIVGGIVLGRGGFDSGADGRRAFRRAEKVSREACWSYRKCEC